MNKEKLKKIVDNFKGKKIIVIGDVMLDEYVFGKVSRISPEAPVPVVEVEKKVYQPGGAAYVASLIGYLSGVPYLISIVGEDTFGECIVKELSKNNISSENILVDKSRPTTLKTRVIAHHQQLVRIDVENKNSIDKSLIERLINNFQKLVKYADGIIISDYAKGVIVPNLFMKVIEIAKKEKKIITVDPKPTYCLFYKGVTAITPNTQEVESSIKMNITDENMLNIAGKKLLNRLNCSAVLITRGEHGMALFEKNKKPYFISTKAKEVFDVTGAGDTVIATFTLSLCAGASFLEAAHISNYAAGVQVGKLGTAKITKEEIIDSFNY
jgi:D-beta-D-heptose 7-phosphate kinase/D-beta-D-heptose 1-phosphate adenosyltransferase